jgi:alginate O-acetyltransferase complex protein AlgI
MLFNSIEFLLFFPIVTTLYFLLKHEYRWLLLLLSSCLFYMAFVPVYLLIIAATIIIDYFAGILIHASEGTRRRNWLVISIISNIAVLFVFKYYNFFISNINAAGFTDIPMLEILLPVGLSFHTFQAMSYTIEVYRGNQLPERHFGIYSLYVLFYPQLVAGPIERPQNILHQFREKHYFNYTQITSGLKQMAWGMFKKVAVADQIAVYVNHVYRHSSEFEGITIGIAIALFSFQIYFDFSGYSDIALGSARTMGFTLMKNFDRPYQSKSIVEFWSRWHISLSSWFRDYLYIPLGGNRKGKLRTYINQFTVFLVSGFWHGANWTFIIWGGLHAIFVATETLIKSKIHFPRIPTMLKTCLVFMLVSVAWVFFRAENITIATQILTSLTNDIPHQISSLIQNKSLARLQILYANQEFDTLAIPIIGILIILFFERKQGKMEIFEYFHTLPQYARVLLYLMMIYSCVLLAAGNQSQFIYFQF